MGCLQCFTDPAGGASPCPKSSTPLSAFGLVFWPFRPQVPKPITSLETLFCLYGLDSLCVVVSCCGVVGLLVIK